MNNEPNGLNELIQRCLHQEASDAEFEMLQSKLRDDPDARRRFLAAGQLESDLSSLFNQEEADMALPELARTSSAKWKWGAVAAVCSVLVLAFGTFTIFRPTSAPSTSAPSIATVVVTGTAAWTINGEAMSPGEVVKLGTATHLELPAGASGSIQLDPEVSLQLVGKGDLTLLDRSTVRLDFGVLHAVVGKASHGFTVLTREGKIVDLGTRFAVDAPEGDGEVILSVFEGSVEVTPKDRSKPLLVKTGQQARLHRGVAKQANRETIDGKRYALVSALDSNAKPSSITLLHHYPLGESGSIEKGVPLDTVGEANFGRSRLNPIQFLPSPKASVPSSSSFARFTKRVIATDADLKKVPTDNFAVEVWARPISPEKQDVCLFTTHSSQTESLRFRLVKGHWAASIGEETWIGAPLGKGQSAKSRWTHLAVIRHQGVSTFYIDGVPQTGTTSATPVHGNAHLGGTPFAGKKPTYLGDLDEIRIFSFPAKTDNPARQLGLATKQK